MSRKKFTKEEAYIIFLHCELGYNATKIKSLLLRSWSDDAIIGCLKRHNSYRPNKQKQEWGRKGRQIQLQQNQEKRKITIELDSDLIIDMQEMCSKIGIDLNKHIEQTLKLDRLTYDNSSVTKHTALSFLVDKDIYKVVNTDETKSLKRDGVMTLYWKTEYKKDK